MDGQDGESGSGPHTCYRCGDPLRCDTKWVLIAPPSGMYRAKRAVMFRQTGSPQSANVGEKGITGLAKGKMVVHNNDVLLLRRWA